MSNFKLIGIRPHKDCGEKFLKVLEPGRLYQFYNEYEFYTEKEKFDGVNGEITHYEFNKTVPEDLYKVGNLNVNISAIVGKNGTGKSSLIDLLLYAIYYLGITFKDNYTNEKLLPKYAELLKSEIKKKQKEYDEWIKTKTDYKTFIKRDIENYSKQKVKRKRDFFISRVFKQILNIEQIEGEVNSLEKNLRYLKAESILVKDENEDFLISIFYQLENIVYEMSFSNEILLFKIDNEKTKIDFNLSEHFFYSTILNYSHHSLNSLHLGHWVNSLFHKNDGYKTPAVINPMREEGNFDINKEIELSKSRLLVNSLFNQLNDIKKLVPISDKQYIHSIEIKRKDNSFFKKSVSLKRDDSNSTFRISGHVIGVNTIEYILNTNELNDIVELGYSGKQKQIIEDLMNYLVNKVHRIQKNYSVYFDRADSSGLEDADQIVNDRKTIEKLNSDFSHVSFKYHRSIYFLPKIVLGEFDDFLKDVEDKKSCSLRDYLLKIGFVNEENEILEDDIFQIFLRVPPPIFEVDFNISKTSDSKKTFCKISDLSSGEQQNIHTINTFIYHLNNTYSVHKESVGKRQKYQFFNAVFDEIELYFHPDYQRRFIKDLLQNIKINKHLIKGDFIKGINLIFSTHSPFILSDIPIQNVLLMGGKEKLNSMQKTFSSNIYDLLANAFFMKDGYIGEYAKSKISEIIFYLNQDEFSHDKQLKYEKIIDLIGDKFIREKLQDMLNLKNKSQANG